MPSAIGTPPIKTPLQKAVERYQAAKKAYEGSITTDPNFNTQVYDAGAKSLYDEAIKGLRAYGSEADWVMYGPEGEEQTGGRNYWVSRAQELGIPLRRERQTTMGRSGYSWFGKHPTDDQWYGLNEVVNLLDPMYEYQGLNRSPREKKEWYHGVPYGEIKKGPPQQAISQAGVVPADEDVAPGSVATRVFDQPTDTQQATGTPNTGTTPTTGTEGYSFGGKTRPSGMTPEQERAWIASTALYSGKGGNLGFTADVWDRYRALAQQWRAGQHNPTGLDWQLIEALSGKNYNRKHDEKKFWKFLDRYTIGGS
jgi:hypothetical protein